MVWSSGVVWSGGVVKCDNILHILGEILYSYIIQ